MIQQQNHLIWKKIVTHYINNNLANTDPYSDPNTLK